MTLGMHGHCNQHFTNADHPCRRMRMLYFTGAQIFVVLLQEPDHTSTRGLELLCCLCQRSKASHWLCRFRGFHFARSVRNHLQKRVLTVRRIGRARSALRTDQLKLDGFSCCEVLNRIKHRPLVGRRLQPALFFSHAGKAVEKYLACFLQGGQQELLVDHNCCSRIGLCTHD